MKEIAIILTGTLLFLTIVTGCETNAGDPDSPYPAVQTLVVGDHFRSEWTEQFIRYNGMVGPSLSFSTGGRGATNVYFPFDTISFRLNRCEWKIQDWTPLEARIEYLGGCDAHQKR